MEEKMKKRRRSTTRMGTTHVHIGVASCVVSRGLRRKPGAQLQQRRHITHSQHATTKQLSSRLGAEDALRVGSLWRLQCAVARV